MEKSQEPVTLELHIEYELQKSTVTIEYNPATGESTIHTVYDPDPTKMHTEELIRLMEEAAFHRLCLQEEEPEDAGADQHLLWQVRCRQVGELFGQAQDELEHQIYKLWDHFGCKNASMEKMRSSLDGWPALWLKDPKHYLAYWYTYGHFPGNSELTELVDLELALRQKLYAPEGKDMHAYRLWKFRCDLRAEQFKEVRKMLIEIQAWWKRRLPANSMNQNWLTIPIQYELQKCTAVIHVDPEDGEHYEFCYYHPEPMHMDEPALISFVEELMFRLVCLQDEEPVDSGEDQQFIWQERCTQVEELLEECKARLRTFGGFFANWYANGCFPEERSFRNLWYYRKELWVRAFEESSAVLSSDSEKLRDFRCSLIAKQQEDLQRIFDTLSAGMKIYKTCRVKCLRCGDVLKYVNQGKEDRLGYLLYCSCGRVGLDPAAVCYRILGDPADYEDISEEWIKM